MMTLAIGALPPTWQTWIIFLTPGFGPAPDLIIVGRLLWRKKLLGTNIPERLSSVIVGKWMLL